MIQLFTSRRFLPLFLVQFFGAFNDNVFKNAFIMWVTYKSAHDMGWNVTTAVNVIMVLLILPAIFFSSLAGQIADRFEKANLVRWTKIGEIAIMALAAWGFVAQMPYLLFGVVFLTGIQISFFGPLKYSILPSHLEKKDLLSGSAIFEAATFVAILLGTGVGGLAILSHAGGIELAGWLPWALCGFAVVGWAAGCAVPLSPSTGAPFPISWNLLASSKEILMSAYPQTGIWRSMLGLSWFWTIGSIWLAFIPPYVAEQLAADKSIANLFIAIFSLGIGLGALLCQKLLKGEISAKYVPLAGLGISFFTLLFVAAQALPASGPFAPLSAKGLVICGCLLGIAVCSGMFSVPLYTILQAWSEASHCSRNIAANNILNSLFMVAGNGTVAVLSLLGMSSYVILSIMAALNIGVSLYIIRIIPESVLHTFLRWILRALFRVKVEGLENYAAARERKVIIANHVSYLDAALLTAFLPELPTFAINTQIAKKWWIRPLLLFIRVYTVDPTNPMAIKSLTKVVKSGVPVVIFPEGRLTITGGVMKVYQGPGMIAVHADADIIPVQLDGVQFSCFSYLGDKVKRHLFPRIAVSIRPPVRIEKPPGNARETRAGLVTVIYDILTEMAFATARKESLLFEALLDAGETHGASFPVVDDHGFSPLTYRKLIARALTIGPRLVSGAAHGEAVGLMLPNSKAAVVSIFGVQSQCRVAALMNFSAGAKNLLSTCATARVRFIWTSSRFIREAKLQKVVDALAAEGVEFRYLEALQEARNVFDSLLFVAGLCAPRLVWQSARKAFLKQLTARSASDAPAVILFTSGSGGTPKAVVLSHKNLLSNVRQLLARIDLQRQDRVFNCLPIFHSFGFTGGTLTPLLAGVRTFMYPSPLHYRIVPELVYQTDSTILFGTNTFLNGYSKKAHPYDFHSVRYVFAGAEKVKEETKKLWSDVFGVRILECYGSTECSPGISINTPMFNQPGTVGKFLPGIACRLEPVPGVARGRRLFVKGPNIMLGYYLPEAPGRLEEPADGWYDTGDIVEISPDGFIRILGRAKRFAKVAGEMVSLTAVEEMACAVWPGTQHAAIAIPHLQKGEEIVLITEKRDPQRKDLLAYAMANGIPELFVPRTLREGKLPLLGTGKPDYVALLAQCQPAPQEAPSEIFRDQKNREPA